MTSSPAPSLSSTTAVDSFANPGPHIDRSARLDSAVPTRLAASAEPRVVFGSLAARSVPEMCDACWIDIVDGDSGHHIVAEPSPPAMPRGLERLLARAADTPGHVVRIAFSAPDHKSRTEADVGWDHEYHGVATFVWDRRTATCSDRALASVLVEYAVRTVSWQRTEQAARDAIATSDHLQIALRTSRHIGIAVGVLMYSQKVTEHEAFERLSDASQRTNRKLRDIALDVAETGCLDRGPTDDLASRRLGPRPAIQPGRPSR